MAVEHKDQRRGARCVGLSPGRWLPGALMALMACAAWGQDTLSRRTEFEYDVGNGQVSVERVDPGLPTCAETRYKYDEYGNRTMAWTGPCGSATFSPRAVQSEFSAQGSMPPGAVLTRSRAGAGSLDGSFDFAAGGLDATHTKSEYDHRFGTLSKSQDFSRWSAGTTDDQYLAIPKTLKYDGLGRLRQEITRSSHPWDKNVDGVALGEAHVVNERAVFYCGAHATAPGGSNGGARCLNGLDLGLGRSVTYASGRLTGSVATRFTSAYVVETVSKEFVGPAPADPKQLAVGTVIGGVTWVHYDSLHREIVKESQNANGRWVRTFTVYDALGQVAGTIGPVFRDDSARVVASTVKWTTTRDLLHRATASDSTWSPTKDLMSPQTSSVEYNGLSVTIRMPEGSSSRTTRTVKDAMGQTVHIEDAMGGNLLRAYDGFGNLRLAEDHAGNRTTIAYTATTARFKESLTDPDKGTWRYSYNGLGQLITQTDARGVQTMHDYDALGRLTRQRSAGGGVDGATGFDAFFSYSVDRNGAECASGYGLLCEAYTVSGTGQVMTSRAYKYNFNGMVKEQTENVGRSFTTGTSYDTVGRVVTKVLPGAHRLHYDYSNGSDGLVRGALSAIRQRNPDGSTANLELLWAVGPDAYDARGNTILARLGNGANLYAVHDPISGKMFETRAGPAQNSNELHNTNYQYDQSGNVAQRWSAHTNIYDNFFYDRLDRLTRHVGLNAVGAVDVSYNAIGNILTKGDLGNYNYNTIGPNGTVRPHAVGQAGGATYTYDNNGNVRTVSGDQQRSFTWNAFNQPEQVTYGGTRSVAFNYDATGKRIKEVINVSGGPGRVLYMAHPDNAGGLGFEQEITYSGTAEASTVTRNENRYYIQVPGATVVLKTYNDNVANAPVNGWISNDANALIYNLKDSLGSVVSVVNGARTVLERPHFDAWGRKYTDPGTGWSIDSTWSPARHANRGFTEHQQLDEVGLVHMNGRMYDPVLARFLSADPVNGMPDVMQSYNGYSYVYNRPMNYYDADGKCWPACAMLIVVAGIAMVADGNKYWRMAGTLMISFAAPYAFAEAGLGHTVVGSAAKDFVVVNIPNSAAYIAAAGVAAAAQPGASPESVISSMVFAGAFGAVGANVNDVAGRVALHGLLGCAQGAMSGGKCGPSAMAAMVGKSATEAGTVMELDDVSLGVVTTIAGGTASVIGGGKFASGAAQAAFGYLFNQMTRGGGGAVRTGVRGFARLAQDLAGADFDMVGEEIWGRTGAGERFRADGIAVSQKGDLLFGHAVAVCEAKCGPTSEMSARQMRIYEAVNRGDFHLEGPKAAALATRLGLELNSGQLRIPTNRYVGVYLGVYEGSTAHLKPGVGGKFNAVFGPLSRGGPEY